VRWIPAIASVPPRSSAASTAGTTCPAGANVIAASTGSGEPGSANGRGGIEIKSETAGSLRAGDDVNLGAFEDRDLSSQVAEAPKP
jgi:hypothetical protein